MMLRLAIVNYDGVCHLIYMQRFIIESFHPLPFNYLSGAALFSPNPKSLHFWTHHGMTIFDIEAYHASLFLFNLNYGQPFLIIHDMSYVPTTQLCATQTQMYATLSPLVSP